MMRYSSGLFICFFSAVESKYSRTLTDVVKQLDEGAIITFATEDTAPDFAHRLMNGSRVLLVLSGKVVYHGDSTRLNVTSISKDLAYDITLEIYRVREADAGTYEAGDNDDLPQSVHNFMEFIVIGKLQQLNVSVLSLRLKIEHIHLRLVGNFKSYIRITIN